MAQESSHPEALENFERAYIPKDKIRRYALRDPDKSRVFGTLGFSEEAGNWEILRDAILEQLPYYPAIVDKQDQYGITHEVTIPVSGPTGKEAPVKTYWIYRWGEDFPRLTTLFINTREWRRWEEERRNIAG
jgi:Domain of unknown function (DUF6883)